MNIEIAIVGVEFAIRPEFGKFKTETIAEHIGKQESGKEKLVVSRIPRVASGGGDKSATCNDEMDVEMLL